jgi:D-alanyl-D-alanine carboxypeptidase
MHNRPLIAALAFLTLMAGPAAAQSNYVRGPYILADAETGRVYEDFDALRPWYPASTTKLMTIYVTFRAILAGELTMSSPVRMSAHAASEPPSKMGFKPGTAMTLENALKMMMVKSANDIAMAVAETVGGSEAGFAARMNQEARRLGMARSSFVNPHGLPDPRQVTTARDMAVLARALLVEFPQYRDFYKLHAIQFGKRVLKNYNPLLERYPGANGMKTGFICASGYNLVASARRGGREMIAVVFGEPSGRQRSEHAAALLDEGFQAGGLFGGPRTTLDTVSSGAAYTTAIDLRPYVCGGKRAQTAAENSDDGPTPRGVVTGSATGAQASHLSAPMYLGPPIKVSIGLPGDAGPAASAPAQPGSVARIPRPRPALPTDGNRAAAAEAFAPLAAATPSAPAQAIGLAAGAPSPLPRVQN